MNKRLADGRRIHLSVRVPGWQRIQPVPAAARLSTLIFQLSMA
jgi:hypothetical protein